MLQHVMQHALTLLQFAQNNAHGDVYVHKEPCLTSGEIYAQKFVLETLQVSRTFAIIFTKEVTDLLLHSTKA